MLKEIIRTYKKIILLVLLVGFASIFWLFGCHRRSNPSENEIVWNKTSYENGGYGYDFSTEDLEGHVTFGIKGYTVKDKQIPVEVQMKSIRDDFSGFVKIIVPGNNGGGIGYQSAFQCVKEEKSKILLTIPQLGNASYFCFEIMDQYGNTMLSKLEVPEFSEWTEEDAITDKQICLGVFTDDPEVFSFMDNMVLDTDDGKVALRLIFLDENCFPDSVSSMEVLSGILVDNYPLFKLDHKQQNVLKSWVKNGGNLILGTGEYGGKVLSGLEQELQIENGDTETVRLHFDKYVDFSGEINISLNQFMFKENAGWKMVKWSEPASYYEKNYGKGMLQVFRFSFTDEAILQWNRLDEMTSSLFRQLLGNIFENNLDQENGLWNMEMALHDFNQSQTPNAFYYGLFFLLYLWALIFIAYVLLRRLQKLEYIWMVVPVLALFFTGCIVLRSRGISAQTQSSLSAIRIVDNDSIDNQIYFLYQNAEGESKEMNFISAVDEMEPMDYEYGQDVFDDTLVLRIQEDYTIGNTRHGFSVAFSEASPGTMRLLQMRENKSVNYGEKTTVFSANIKGNHTSFSGDINNLSDKDFDKVIAIRGNEYWCSQNLKSDCSVRIDSKDVKCWKSFEEIEDIFLQENDTTVTMDILNYLNYRYMKNNNNLDDIIVIGIDLNDKFQLLRGNNMLGNQVSVFVNHIKVNPPEKGDCYLDMNQQWLKEHSNMTEFLSEILDQQEPEVEYQFDSNKVLWTMARNEDDYQGKIYAYNYWTGEKDEILTKCHDILSGEELRPYLSENNEMKLTYQFSDEDTTIPVFSVWLKKSIN